MAKRPVPRYDFKAFGEAIKTAWKGRKESRKKVYDEILLEQSAGRSGGAAAFCSTLVVDLLRDRTPFCRG